VQIVLTRYKAVVNQRSSRLLPLGDDDWQFQLLVMVAAGSNEAGVALMATVVLTVAKT
jgi:hypothetical protein